jgi:hypothetical protein
VGELEWYRTAALQRRMSPEKSGKLAESRGERGHFGGLSPFRPCTTDLAQFFKNREGRYVKLT